MNQQTILQRLMSIIEDRKANPPDRSYTTSLFAGGVDKIGAKILEEAGEVVDAARETEAGGKNDHLIHETADLIYHLMVMMAQGKVSLEDVERELANRFGVSGLDEKAARGKSS